MFNGRIESHSRPLESDEIFRTRDDGFEFYVFADGSWSLIADNEIKYREYELVTGPPRSPYTRIKVQIQVCNVITVPLKWTKRSLK